MRRSRGDPFNHLREGEEGEGSSSGKGGREKEEDWVERVPARIGARARKARGLCNRGETLLSR